MAVAEMKKVFLVAHREDREALTRVLQRLGVLQVEDFLDEIQSDDATFDDLMRDEPGEQAAKLDARLADLKFCLDFLQRLVPERTTFIQQFAGTKVYLKESEFRNYLKDEERIAHVRRALRSIDEELTHLRNEETKKENLLTLLAPWQALDVPLEELRPSPEVGLELGTLTLPAAEEAAFAAELEETSPGAYFEVISREREEARVFVLYVRADEEAVQAFLHRRSFNRVIFPELSGTVKEVLERTKAELTELNRRREELLAEARQYVSERLLLKAAYDEANLERSRLELVQNFARTQETFALTGWIKARDWPRLERAVAGVSPTAYLTARDAQEGDNPPVALQNNRAVRPFEAVTELYGLPVPGGIDPTPYLAPFFFVFFGLMYGDAAYGLILAGLSWYAMQKIRMAGLAQKLFTLLIIGGGASFLAGAITGSWFGSLPIPPLWFSTMDNPIKMLGVAMALGVIQIFTGLIIQMIADIRSGKILDAIYDQGLWLVFLTGLILLLLSSSLPALASAGKALSLVGALGLILTQGRANKNIIKRLLSGIVSLYGVSGYLSDVLSYSRLLALGLGTTVIGMVINNMVVMVGQGGPVGWIIAALIAVAGHGFNLIINVLGAYVHASRLQYVEFFTKFYESGGRPFSPFRLSTKYIDLELEEREA
ncbi:MAG: V/A-type H+/Na+-transporting ATPase subunit [Bacillota bacterium]|jgi:V/A-type H+-transporting ATPase subunit I|nr:V/A-type H+/Na+-transporting ATPase subunit [Bacillota bacterium]MDK2856347.1 V/A-type H+/Na+-transporting ATPase subunit [Bacillota bacterium]MDK2925112.1 V/A-type H+/Na+-transporting ATPase subunit [Bacillota bacterium]